MKKTLLAQRKEDDEEWLRDNILYSSYSILEKVCQLLIVSLEGVKKLGLKIEERPHPYKLSWLKNGGDEGHKRCMVPFSIRKKVRRCGEL